MEWISGELSDDNLGNDLYKTTKNAQSITDVFPDF